MVINHSIAIGMDLLAISEEDAEPTLDFEFFAVSLDDEDVGAVVEVGLDSIADGH